MDVDVIAGLVGGGGNDGTGIGAVSREEAGLGGGGLRVPS